MGCAADKDARVNIDQIYRQKNLPYPEGYEFENEFEREAF